MRYRRSCALFERVEKRLAIAVISAYRTVSHIAVTVIAGIARLVYCTKKIAEQHAGVGKLCKRNIVEMMAAQFGGWNVGKMDTITHSRSLFVE